MSRSEKKLRAVFFAAPPPHPEGGAQRAIAASGTGWRHRRRPTRKELEQRQGPLREPDGGTAARAVFFVSKINANKFSYLVLTNDERDIIILA